MSTDGVFRVGSSGFEIKLTFKEQLASGLVDADIEATDTLALDLMEPNGTLHDSVPGTIENSGSVITWTHDVATASPLVCPGLWRARFVRSTADGHVDPGSWYKFKVGV